RPGAGHRDTLVPRDGVEPVQQPLSPAEQDRDDGQVEPVDQAGTQVLLDGRDSATDPDVQVARGFPGAFQRLVDAAGDKVEGSTVGHLHWFARMVGEHEHRVAERRVLPPPTPPRVARRPRATARAEHVVAHDGGPDAVVAVPDEPEPPAPGFSSIEVSDTDSRAPSTRIS